MLFHNESSSVCCTSHHAVDLRLQSGGLLHSPLIIWLLLLLRWSSLAHIGVGNVAGALRVHLVVVDVHFQDLLDFKVVLRAALRRARSVLG